MVAEHGWPTAWAEAGEGCEVPEDQRTSLLKSRTSRPSVSCVPAVAPARVGHAGRLQMRGMDRDLRDGGGALTITVESGPTVMGCPSREVLAHGRGRVVMGLVDAPAMW